MNAPLPPSRRLVVDRMQVQIHPSRAEMGAVAGREVAAYLRLLLAAQPEVRAIFACAPSQNEFLEALVGAPGIEWSRVTAFHMDEYVGLTGDHPASFRSYLAAHFHSRVTVRRFYPIRGEEPATEKVCAEYSRLLGADPIDLVCMGIGENGHIAFNDPPVADFQDPVRIKRVELDLACRTQQVNDGCFASLAAVPTHALTLTVPALLAGKRLFCMVPGERKAAAVAACLQGPVTPACPASILRTHPEVTLYLDQNSAGALSL